MASLFARTIYKLGFRVADERAVKPKHILAALEEWRKTADDGALKNRMAFIRWMGEKTNRPNIIPRKNAELGIGKRAYKTNVSKALHGSAAMRSTSSSNTSHSRLVKMSGRM